ncbi:squalene/phytoene synthase family protein [Sandarakinorhabdus glacialis]|uniref:squalene/phytoene synthase family protein n=1 Tax=Sandarakinorhabdus glacialis TaxID=1614636 RepID=UPI0035312FEA
MTSPLDIVTAEVRERDRDRYLSILYAPASVRPALMALHGLDLELGQVVAGTTEPMIGEIRLAWWREALEGLDQGKVPAQPLLQLLAGEVLPRGVTGAELAGLEDRWIGLIGAEDVPAEHVGGGGLLFALAARLLGGEAALGELLGTAWALGEASDFGRVPTALRPLLALVRLSARDAAQARAGQPREPRGSAGRQLRMLRAIAFGR